jgi:hypothetical protein
MQVATTGNAPPEEVPCPSVKWTAGLAARPSWCFDIGPRTRALLAERGFNHERVEREGKWYCHTQPFQLIVQGDPPYALIRKGEAFVDAVQINRVREREEKARRSRPTAAAGG